MLKAFFVWLAGETDYRTRIKQADAEYFNAPDNLARVVTARRHKPCASLKQICAVLDAMPTSTEIECRDRALIAFTIFTGARDRAIVSFRLKHIDVQHELLEQDALAPCFPLLCSEKQAIFLSFGTTSGQHFFKFCRLFRWLWCFHFAARTAIIPPQNKDIFLMFQGRLTSQSPFLSTRLVQYLAAIWHILSPPLTVHLTKVSFDRYGGVSQLSPC